MAVSTESKYGGGGNTQKVKLLLDIFVTDLVLSINNYLRLKICVWCGKTRFKCGYVRFFMYKCTFLLFFH